MQCSPRENNKRTVELVGQLGWEFASVIASSEPQGLHVGPQCLHPEWESMPVVTYVGSSPLPQLPWPAPRHEPVPLVSLFDGIGGALVALMALGMTFAAVCVEWDSQAVQIVQRSFRHVRHWPDVTTFDIALLEPALQSRRFSSVLVIGQGAPHANKLAC